MTFFDFSFSLLRPSLRQGVHVNEDLYSFPQFRVVFESVDEVLIGFSLLHEREEGLAVAQAAHVGHVQRCLGCRRRA